MHMIVRHGGWNGIVHYVEDVDEEGPLLVMEGLSGVGKVSMMAAKDFLFLVLFSGVL
jgi:hypothetical protein